MLELFNQLAALTGAIVIVGATLLVAFVISLAYLWRHHRDWFVREDLDRSP